MAFIPDEAVDRMTELSAGAWKLYTFLCRCRNQASGKCCPSLSVTMESIGAKKSQTYEFRKELSRAKWAKFEGDTVTELLGFNIPKSRKKSATAKTVTPTAPSFTETFSEIPENSEISESVSEIPENNSEIPETFSDISEKLSEIPESHIRKNQQRNQQREPAKDKARTPSVVPTAVAFIRHLTHRYPDKTLWPRIVKTLGEDFDEERLTDCYENWVSHGWNKMNFVWLFEWYPKGIPHGQNGRDKPTLADRNRAACEEAGRMLGIHDDNVIEGEVL